MHAVVGMTRKGKAPRIWHCLSVPILLLLGVLQRYAFRAQLLSVSAISSYGPEACTTQVLECPHSTGNRVLWSPCSSTLNQPMGHPPVDSESFTVQVCADKHSGRLSVLVSHHGQQNCAMPPVGNSGDEALVQTLGSTYVEALLDGPELRLLPLEYQGMQEDGVPSSSSARAPFTCLYALDASVRLDGPYHVEIVAVYTLLGYDQVAQARNYLLSNTTHDFALGPRKGSDSVGTTGAWRLKVDEHGRAHSSSPFPGYRCPLNGVANYQWYSVASSAMVVSPSQAVTDSRWQACTNALAHAQGQSHPQIVMVGDSLMRQTFNSLAPMLGPEAVASKEFKSLVESQCWGGDAQGVELCFLWAPYPNDAQSRATGMEDAFMQKRSRGNCPLPRSV